MKAPLARLEEIKEVAFSGARCCGCRRSLQRLC